MCKALFVARPLFASLRAGTSISNVCPRSRNARSDILGSRSTLSCACRSVPGALKEFLSILGPEDDIARFEYMKKSARNFGSVLIGIETRKPENFMRLFAHLDEAGFTYTDITEDETLAQFVI